MIDGEILKIKLIYFVHADIIISSYWGLQYQHYLMNVLC